MIHKDDDRLLAWRNKGRAVEEGDFSLSGGDRFEVMHKEFEKKIFDYKLLLMLCS